MGLWSKGPEFKTQANPENKTYSVKPMIYSKTLSGTITQPDQTLLLPKPCQTSSLSIYKPRVKMERKCAPDSDASDATRCNKSIYI